MELWCCVAELLCSGLGCVSVGTGARFLTRSLDCTLQMFLFALSSSHLP